MLHYCSLRASPENLILSALQGNSKRRQRQEKMGNGGGGGRRKKEKDEGRASERVQHIRQFTLKKIILTTMLTRDVG